MLNYQDDKTLATSFRRIQFATSPRVKVMFYWLFNTMPNKTTELAMFDSYSISGPLLQWRFHTSDKRNLKPTRLSTFAKAINQGPRLSTFSLRLLHSNEFYRFMNVKEAVLIAHDPREWNSIFSLLVPAVGSWVWKGSSISRCFSESMKKRWTMTL